MATESTAIVNLIDLMRKRPMPTEADDDLLFGGNARFDATAMPVQAAPVMLPQPGPHYDHVRLPVDDRRTVRKSAPAWPVRKIAISAGAVAAVTFVLTIYLAKRDSAPAAASVTPRQAAVAAIVTPPPAAEPTTPAAVVTPSEPKVETTVTPIETAAAPADPDNKFTANPALAPTVPTGPVVAPEESPVVAAADRPAKTAKKGSRSKSTRAAQRTRAPKRETKVAMIEPVKKVKLGGKGQLAISSESGGTIWVDGRSMTSSRMTLEPGKHNVTMFDKKTKKAKTFQVEIKPNQTTNVRR